MTAWANAEPIPIFPLDSVVLFPKVRVPLHTFEPRYRQMTRDALAGDRRIGMVVVRPEHCDDMQGSPPVFPIGCEGIITQAEKLPSGSYNIVLLGVRRFRVRDEQPESAERLYRVASIQPLEDPLPQEDRTAVATLRRRCFSSVRDLATRISPQLEEPISSDLFSNMDDEMFVNALSQSLDFGCLEKQGLLEAESIRHRFEQLDGLLRFRLAEMATSGGSPSNALQ